MKVALSSPEHHKQDLRQRIALSESNLHREPALHCVQYNSIVKKKTAIKYI